MKVKSAGGMGLKALAEKYLGRTLDKDWRIRGSDWEADTLTKRQVCIVLSCSFIIYKIVGICVLANYHIQ